METNSDRRETVPGQERNPRKNSMNVLGISGSLNADGNTAFAVRRALEIIRQEGIETQYISLAGKDIHPCDGCWSCAAESRCQYQDDMEEIITALRWCHGLILGSPVHFGMVSGSLKVMMDRCVLLRPSYGHEMEMTGKVGGGIACGEFRNGGQETTLQNIHLFLLQQNMRVVSDGPGFSHAGGTIVGDAKGDEMGLRTVENLAHNLGYMLRQPGA
jgi:multimeric flavodoxin WrbA